MVGPEKARFWIVRLVQGMCANARSRVCVCEGFSQEFEVKVEVPCSSSLCWMPCHVSFGLVFPGRTYMQITADSLEECVRRLVIWKDMERSHGKEGVEGKCRKDKGHDLWYRL